MRLSNIIVLVATTTFLGASNAISIDQKTTSKTVESSSTHSLQVGPNNADSPKCFLRDVDSDTPSKDEEERAVNFSSLLKLIPGTAANKAAKAAKEVARQADLAKGLDGMLSNGNNMYKQFGIWREQGVTDKGVLYALDDAGRLGQNEVNMVNFYKAYLDDFKAKAT